MKCVFERLDFFSFSFGFYLIFSFIGRDVKQVN